jgi:hypothetical protein
MKSWKTTAIGVLGILVVVCNAALKILNGQPIGQSDLAMITAVAIPNIGLLFSRDNDKSSKDVGVKL